MPPEWIATLGSALIAGVVALLVTTLQLRAADARSKGESAAAERRRVDETEAAERRRYQALDAEFLAPLGALLDQNRRYFDELIGGFMDLEYDPQELRSFLDSLPRDDVRVHFWLRRIDGLRRNNRALRGLIQQYSRDIVTAPFRDACQDFWFHADHWEDVWSTVEHLDRPSDTVVDDGPPIPPAEIRRPDFSDTVRAIRFPGELPEALNREREEVMRRGGLVR